MSSNIGSVEDDNIEELKGTKEDKEVDIWDCMIQQTYTARCEINLNKRREN